MCRPPGFCFKLHQIRWLTPPAGYVPPSGLLLYRHHGCFCAALLGCELITVAFRFAKEASVNAPFAEQKATLMAVCPNGSSLQAPTLGIPPTFNDQSWFSHACFILEPDLSLNRILTSCL